MRYIMYQDKRGQWRWRLVAENHKTIATSGGDGYHNEQDCRDAIGLVQNANHGIPIEHGRAAHGPVKP